MVVEQLTALLQAIDAPPSYILVNGRLLPATTRMRPRPWC
jgi:hypothetical protein